MEIQIVDLSQRVTQLDLVRALVRVLHRPPLHSNPDTPPYNFVVKLSKPDQVQGQHAGYVGMHNAGWATLILPTKSLGDRFMDLVEDGKVDIKFHEKLIRFENPRPCLEQYAKHLKKLRFISLDEQEELERVKATLDCDLSVKALWMGILENEANQSVTFRPEWTPVQTQFYLTIEHRDKLVRLKLGHPSFDEVQHHISFSFDNIKRILYGDEFMEQYVVFQLYYPPAYEWNNMPQGLEEVPRNSRSRVSELSETHGRVAPFLCDIHITLTNFEEIDHLKKWTTLCNLPTPIPGRIPSEPINAYSHNNQRRISDWFSRLDFRVGFQLEALRRNGVLNPLQLWSLKAKIEKILKERGTEVTASILRQFNDVACRRHRISSMVDIEKELDTCIESVSKARVTVPLERLMFVHRVTQTPCAMRLAGPHLIQSNRVLRRYHAHHHLFLRVDFRDEQQLQLRWAAEVNGEKFVEERVGDILKKGFQIAGRHFDFLAYSNAALKEHSVWFVSPFEDPVDGLVDAEIIRSRLGDFTKAIECPALFGARLAQAFSATEVAVTLEPHEWDEIPDIKRGKWIHTDGVGVMSLELAERIWAVMNQHNRNPSPLPSVYQVRIGGYKGVIVIDYTLEGIRLYLRPSMKKFDFADANTKPRLEIEIARAFVNPMKFYLNRPLIQILEFLAVTPENLLKFQKAALDDIGKCRDSMKGFLNTLRTHDLGKGFSLGQTLKNLLQLTSTSNEGQQTGLDSSTVFGPFVRSLVDYAVVHTLREIKYKARIPIPNSYHLVGVADEGWRLYKQHRGQRKVRVLKDRQIFAAIRDPETHEVKYLKGQAWITRSPNVHPGDVQTVYAVGKPDLEEGEICFFDKLVNCVVFSCAGDPRNLPSFLGGGDLDGDTYMICQQGELLLPCIGQKPASYEPLPKTLLGRPSTVEDVANFVVTYINYDKLGLLCSKQQIRADQSNDAVFDDGYLKLAELCSQAVDFVKTGTQPEMDKMPRRYMEQEPDWNMKETTRPDDPRYYRSDRALGQLFRAVSVGKIPTPSGRLPPGLPVSQGHQLIGRTLRPVVEKYCGSQQNLTEHRRDIKEIFEQYVVELNHLAYSHALSTDSLAKLQEEEIVLGTIMAPSTQERHRKEMMSSLRLNARELVNLVSSQIGEFDKNSPRSELAIILARVWTMWCLSVQNTGDFGKHSFGLIALDIFFRVLAALEDRQDLAAGVQGNAFYTGTYEPRDVEPEDQDQDPEINADADLYDEGEGYDDGEEPELEDEEDEEE